MLVTLLQKPKEAVFHNAFSTIQAACVRIAIDLKLFHALDTDDSLKTADLPKLCFIEEINVLTYSTSPIAHALTDPPLEAMCIHVCDQGLPSIANLPIYMKQTGYQSLSEGRNGPFQAGQRLICQLSISGSRSRRYSQTSTPLWKTIITTELVRLRGGRCESACSKVLIRSLKTPTFYSSISAMDTATICALSIPASHTTPADSYYRSRPA